MMKNVGIGLVLMLTMLFCTPIAVNAQSDSAAKATMLLGLEQSLCNALPGDSATWSQYLDAGWYVIQEDGTGAGRNKFLDGFGSFPKGVSGNIVVTHPVCLFHDSMAVVHYVADEHETVFGQNLHTSYAVMDVWYRTPKSWTMLSMQIFEVPQLPAAVKPDLTILKIYTGVYEMGGGRTAEVSVIHDTLFIQKKNHDRIALLQETNNVFFSTTDTRGRKIFIKDASGNMLMLERRNGQDIVWRKTTTN